MMFDADASASTLPLDEMRLLLSGDHDDVRRASRALCSDNDLFARDDHLQTENELSVRAARQLTQERVRVACAERIVTSLDAAYAPARYIAFFEALTSFDIAFAMKVSIQYNLFGAALRLLGTERHSALLSAVDSGELPGCFGMTELGHGSNVQGLETLARYDAAAQQFILHSPSDTAQKFWIGGAAMFARAAVVFAQLELGGKAFGVHAFYVPLRDADGKTLPGVQIADCGHKSGLNAVDNGRIRFTLCRIPHWCLLNRYADVTPEGVYQRKLRSEAEVFAAHVQALLIARLTAGMGSLLMARVGLVVAVGYGLHRRQFVGSARGDAQGETLLLDYAVHRQRVLVPLCEAYAMWSLHNHVKGEYDAFCRAEASVLDPMKRDTRRGRRVHGLMAAYKAMTTWHGVDTLQACRESCGGMGFLSRNMIGVLRADADAFVTFDGDNTVLMQQVARLSLHDLIVEARQGGFLGQLRRSVGSVMASYLGQSTLGGGDYAVDYLASAAFFLEALERRRARLTETLARRLRARTSANGGDAVAAWNDCATHATALGRAHCELLLVQAFCDVVANKVARNSAWLPVMEAMCAVDALTRICADPWFTASGALSARQWRAARQLIGTLLDTHVRRHALALVRVFDVGDKVWTDTCANPSFASRL